VLVLAGGGVLGEAWMQGVLAGYEDVTGHDFRTARGWVGTSAGSIVAATLAAGRRPRRPGEGAAVTEQAGDAGAARTEPTGLRRLARFGAAATAPFAPVALAVGAPGGAALRAAALARASGGTDRLRGLREEVDRSGARWDGRLRVVTVDRGSGRRVVFGTPEAPEATVGEAVQASCSIPWVFRPVTIRGREYVDGGVWSIANLDVAPAERGMRVLCLNPTQDLEIALTSPLGFARAIGSAGTALELATLRRRGVKVRSVGPGPEPARFMARGLMNGRFASEVLLGGYRQGRALASG
jgi:NTE family protein